MLYSHSNKIISSQGSTGVKQRRQPHPRVHFNRLSNCRVECDIACPLVLSTLDQVSATAVKPLDTFASSGIRSLMSYIIWKVDVRSVSLFTCDVQKVWHFWGWVSSWRCPKTELMMWRNRPAVTFKKSRGRRSCYELLHCYSSLNIGLMNFRRMGS